MRGRIALQKLCETHRDYSEIRTNFANPLRTTGSTLGTSKGFSQLAFGAFQDLLLSFRQIFAGAIDVKIQHRH
jgi:hypothetical protein